MTEAQMVPLREDFSKEARDLLQKSSEVLKREGVDHDITGALSAAITVLIIEAGQVSERDMTFATIHSVFTTSMASLLDVSLRQEQEKRE